MFANVLSRRGITLTLFLVLDAISSHATQLASLSHSYTAARAANEGDDKGFMNNYLLSASTRDPRLALQPIVDPLPPIMVRTSSIDIVCPSASPIFFVWIGSPPKNEHRQNILEWYYSGHPVVLWYHPEGLSERNKRKIRNIEKIYTDPRTGFWYSTSRTRDWIP